jgi:hypothetical protein
VSYLLYQLLVLVFACEPVWACFVWLNACVIMFVNLCEHICYGYPNLSKCCQSTAS